MSLLDAIKRALIETFRPSMSKAQMAGYYAADIDIATPLVIHVKSGAVAARATIELRTLAALSWELFEGATCTVDGTVFAACRNNRNIGGVADSVFFRTPTTTVPGTSILTGAMFSPAVPTVLEFAFKPSTSYRLVLTTVADNNAASIVAKYFVEP